MAITWTSVGSIKGDKGNAGTSTRAANIDITANTDVAIDQLSPSTGVQVGDLIVDKTGNVFTIASIVDDSKVHVGESTGVSLKGAQGEKGEDGKDGTGVSIKGSVENAAALPQTGNKTGDAYITQDNGHLYTWDGAQWVDCGEIKGEKGDKGEAGKDGEKGETGQRGSKWTTGTSTPTATDALAGDMYLDTTTWDVYVAVESA